MHEDVDRTDVETQLLAEAQHAVVVHQIDDVARGLGAVSGGFGRPRQRRRGTAYKAKPRSLSGESECDPLSDTAAGAGGVADPNPPQDYGFMYGRSVEDPDGHIWEIMWMDAAAAEKGAEAFNTQAA